MEEVLARPADYAKQEDERLQSQSYKLLKEELEGVLLNSLTKRESKVMYLRWGLTDGNSRTQAQVGQEIGRSRSTVSRIERKALRKLRHPSHSEVLRDYLS